MNDCKQKSGPQEASILLRAIDRLIRPLIRLMINKGIGFPQIRELLKTAYVEEADKQFQINDKRPSDSRIFILTGVHRKDIKRLRDMQDRPPLTGSKHTSLGGALISRWLGEPEYQDEKGQPLCLPRTSDDQAPCFDELIKSLNKDVRPRVILDEWLRSGMVQEDDQGRICIKQDAFILQQGFEDKVFYLGRHLHDHIATCANNILNSNDPHLERSVYFTYLTPKSVEELRKKAESDAIELIQTLNKQALVLQKKDEGKKHAVYKMRFGAYWFDDLLNKNDKKIS